MRSGLFLPLFDPLADPAAVARLAGKAEEAGWDGFFVWDQIHWREPVAAVGDTQVTLAAIAAATERICLGPLVTPLARRRPAKVARETAALDLLSGGRLTLGVGRGIDRFASEYSITGAAARATSVDADEREPQDAQLPRRARTGDRRDRRFGRGEVDAGEDPYWCLAPSFRRGAARWRRSTRAARSTRRAASRLHRA